MKSAPTRFVFSFVNGVVFLVDDGTSEDLVAGDRTFTCNNAITSRPAPLGPRLLRLFAQVFDAAGMRHATLVDSSPFSVEEEIGATETMVPDVTSPAGREPC